MNTTLYRLCMLAIAISFAACDKPQNTKANPAAPSENTENATASVEKAPAAKPEEAPQNAQAATTKNVATTVANAGQEKPGCVYGNAVTAAENAADKGTPAGEQAQGCGTAPTHKPAAIADKAQAATGRPQGCGNLPVAKPIVANQKTHYGNPFVQTGSAPIPVDKLIASSNFFTNTDVLVAGRINKVCKKKGCWFVLQGAGDGTNFVRVTMKHSFFVPTDCEGKTVEVEGTFRSVPLPEAARKHLAEDGGEDPSKVKGSAVELTLVATGVSIQG